MANKIITELSDKEIERMLSNRQLKPHQKEILIRELSARYADKIIGNSKPDPYFRRPEINNLTLAKVPDARENNNQLIFYGPQQEGRWGKFRNGCILWCLTGGARKVVLTGKGLSLGLRGWFLAVVVRRVSM